MKTAWRIFIVSILVFTVTAPVLISSSRAEGLAESFYFGVTFGSNSVTEAKQLIDKVSSYTNLFVVDSWDISGAPNSTALDEICNYAVGANMYFMVYFYMIYYNATIKIGNVYNASTWDAYGVNLWHISWLSSARERWGNKFLGVYLYDEPGGKQIDKGYWAGNTTTFSGTPVKTFTNISRYDDAAAANRYISSISRNRGMQILTNSSFPQGLNYTIPVFTSDYALYWFDYKAGYNAVFAEIGGNRGISSKIPQIALCRGAAKSQEKDWGAIITWATDNPPSPESGSDMLQDLTMAYNAGAKYILVFNYQMSGYGGLTDEHFNAIKQFWTNIHSSGTREKNDGQVALMLPSSYGWGMRNPNDIIWGLWPADNRSAQIWENTNKLIDKYGLKLDIVYDDPQFSVNGKYAQTYMWNDTIIFEDGAASSNSTSNGFFILTAVAVPLGTVSCLSVFLVVRRRKPRRPVELCVQESTSNSNQNEVLKETYENEKRTMFKEFKQTLSALSYIVDPLFDLLMSLQSDIDWDNIEDYLKWSKQATLNSGNPALTEKSIFENLSFAIHRHQKKEIAKETQSILKLIYENTTSSSLKNQFSESHNQDSVILKTAISAYFTLNDILLGQIVGDEKLAKEKIELANFLIKLSRETQKLINSALLTEFTDKLSAKKMEQIAVDEVRDLLLKQLQELLD